MTYTAQQQKLMRHLGLRPWISREIGQEARAQVLHTNALKAQWTGFTPRTCAGSRAAVGAAVLEGIAHEGGRKGIATKAAVASGGSATRKGSGFTGVERRGAGCSVVGPGDSKPDASKPDVSKIDVSRQHDEAASGQPSPLSLIYAQVLPQFWLVAECDEWDRGSQVVFQRLLKACIDLAVKQGAVAPSASQVEWFHWPLRLPVPIANDEHSLRQALRGWVNGRRQSGALWVSLGRRFVELLMPTSLPKGERHQGRSGMDVIWFEGLPAMQIEPEHKSALWQFIQSAVPGIVIQSK